jgi:phosphate starvation-inducible PhoH-like protein
MGYAILDSTPDPAMSEATISLDSRDEALLLFGSRDQYLREIRTQLGMQQLVGRGDQILLKGTDEQLSLAERVFGQLRQMLRQQGSLTGEDVKTVLEVVLQGGERIGPQAEKPAEGGSRFVRPRTDGQARYVRAMRDHDLTICVGPAGTGKTWLGVGMAVSMLRQAAVKKIVLVRPAVEAGERLGFLPGDIAAKVNPYLRPLFDALNDMMEPEQVKRYMENDIIEIVPLAFMRGRTLNQAVIILDEGQNTTIPQMKMFLTRMGSNSKIIVTGDVTQVDLPKQTRSGLMDAVHRLRDIDRIALVYLDENDIVRNPLVQQILRAYEDERPRKKKE